MAEEYRDVGVLCDIHPPISMSLGVCLLVRPEPDSAARIIIFEREVCVTVSSHHHAFPCQLLVLRSSMRDNEERKGRSVSGDKSEGAYHSGEGGEEPAW